MTAPANQTQHVPAGSPAGGQFAVGSHVPPKGGHAAKAPLGPLTIPLAYNAKGNTGPGYNVKGGDPHVHALQQKLNALGYTDNSGKALQVDGKYGPLTTQAIQAVQKAVGLKPDGIVTPQLYARIMASPTTAAKAAQPHVVAKPHVAKHHRSSSTLHPEATERLHEYWVHGEGAAKIAWGAPGDFDRCVAELGKYIGDPEGYCNLAHHEATGMWPAQHAALEKGHRSVPAYTSAARAELSTADINNLPDSDFAYIESGGTKDSSGKTVPRGLRHFPIHDAAHVRDALSRAPQSPFGKQAMPKIEAAAKKFGIDAGDDSGRSAAPSPYVRSFPLEDISIRTGAGADGRTVDAYAAVYDVPVPIHDQDGDYIEVIDPHAFDRILGKVAPSGSRRSWNVGVFYNHGMTIHGTPSDLHSMPIGVPLEIKSDSKGLFTRTQYLPGPETDRILDAIKAGSLNAYSFSGRFDRSTPARPRGGFRPSARGVLPTVRRTESTLREYGPTPFPAYRESEIVGVRAEQITEQLHHITELLRSGAPLDSPLLDPGAPEWDSPSEDSPIPRRSGRSVKEEMQAARSAFLQRYGSR